MESQSIVLTLLQRYSSKQRSATVEFGEVADFVRNYAQHHLSENAELSAYLGSTDDALQEELKKLHSAHQIVLTIPSQGKELIFVISSFIARYAEIYKDIELNITVPFPNINDLPKNVPSDIVSKQQADDFINKVLEKEELNDKCLYGLLFSKNIPALLFPSSVSVQVLIKLCLKKLQDMLRREEYHDYFLKKLTISNPGKELAIKNFFTMFVSRPEDSLLALRTSGDNFYYWSQLCYFIRQDYTKLKDFTVDDINTLQSISVVELVTTFYKNKASDRAKREYAFKEFDTQIRNPPYYFTKKDIEDFRDSHGKLLLGQYSQEELNAHLAELHAETVGNSLPSLLIFKVDEQKSYFILKEKIMPLIIRLCNDARLVIRESLGKLWFKSLLEFETLPEMKEQPAFERCLEQEVKSADPVLYALLHASFLPVVAFEDSTPGRITLYRNGVLVPYSELLLISRQEIYSNSKIKLPFWYSLPGLSWVLAMIRRKPKNKKKGTKQTATEKLIRDEKAAAEEKMQQLNDKDADGPKSRKRALRKVAAGAEGKLVPTNSTLDRELNSYLSEWNDRLGEKAYDNLTQDVNSLIRDYLRKVLRTIKTESLTAERISSLANSLADSPSLVKIKNHPALTRYIELYIIKLLKNIPA